MKTRKELKAEYKELKSQMGVFQIENMSNGKILIDNSIDVNAKWNRHKAQLKFGVHSNKALQKDWNSLGEAHFKFMLLSEIEYKEEGNPDYKEELKILEEMVIGELNLSKEILYLP